MSESSEYLDDFLKQTKQFLPDNLYQQLHCMALPPPDWITNSEQTGVMVAVMAPESLAKAMGEANMPKYPNADESNLHVTLSYLGKVDDFDEETFEKLSAAVGEVANRHPPLEMKISGFGKFNEGSNGVPVYAVANAKGLSRLQADVEETLGKIIELPSEHGWVPHMTLGYVEPEKSVNLPALKSADSEKLQWKSNEISLVMAGCGESFPLKGGKLKKSEGENESDERFEILCSEPEKQVAYYLVARPNMKDAHGHRITREEIEKGAYSYMNHQKLKFEHVIPIDGAARLVESILIPDDVKTFHGEEVIPGDWIIGIHYKSPKLWKTVIDGDYGISWAGWAARVTDD